jgi:hypothetical protein
VSAIYWTTPTGRGYSESEETVPETATVITEDEYNAILSGIAQKQADTEQQVVTEARDRWSLVHDGLMSAGVPEAAATVLANAVGIPPEG